MANEALKKTDEKKEAVKAPANVQPQAEVDPIMVEVTNSWNLREAVQALINNIVDQIRTAKNNPDEVEKVASKLKERSGSYADAIFANTTYAPAYEVHKEEVKDKKS
jgi:hypothetical protein